MSLLLKPALTLHLLTETPASLTFLFTPHSQLPAASPEAKLILHNLGGLLLSTNLICLVLLLTPDRDHADSSTNRNDEVHRLSALVCLCLGTYHVWPLRRAMARMGVEGGRVVLGGPKVHFVVHLVCLGALVGGGVGALLGW